MQVNGNEPKLPFIYSLKFIKTLYSLKKILLFNLSLISDSRIIVFLYSFRYTKLWGQMKKRVNSISAHSSRIILLSVLIFLYSCDENDAGVYRAEKRICKLTLRTFLIPMFCILESNVFIPHINHSCFFLKLKQSFFLFAIFEPEVH